MSTLMSAEMLRRSEMMVAAPRPAMPPAAPTAPVQSKGAPARVARPPAAAAPPPMSSQRMSPFPGSTQRAS